jgi:RES domain-containing protein
MEIERRLVAWSGEAYRHVPGGARSDVLDFRFAGRASENRWNKPGDPTLYLAGDEGVLIAEWGRHFSLDRSKTLRPDTDERAVYRLSLMIDRLLDLRQSAAWEALSLAGAPGCFLDLPVARAISQFIRQTTPAQGLIVPSAAFLDRLDRWCLVLFLEKLPAEPDAWITAVERAGLLRREG